MSFYQGQNSGPQKMPPLGDVLASMGDAVASGATQMQPRNMAMTQFPPAQLDPNVQQDYINDDTTLLDGGNATRQQPRHRQQYIEQEEDDDVVVQSVMDTAKAVNLEDTYNALQLPIIAAVLFFLFQLPILKTWEFNYMSFGFTGEGNWNTSGIFINSLLFSGVFFILQKVLAF